MGALLRHLDIDATPDEFAVSLEQADDQGRTDIELTGPGTKVIIEAKQGWLVPDDQQFSLYASRFEGFEQALFVSLSDSSTRWADQLLRPIAGVPVVHVAWDTVRDALKTSISRTRGREQFWLQQLEGYMGQATSRRPLDDQWVFCVVASDALFGGTTFRDWVREERVYFHPYGGHNTWPKRPPNFLCFRWDGRVQQVNRVEDFEVVSRLDERWPSMDETDSASAPSRPVADPHIIYDLGPDIPLPPSPISTKGTYATGQSVVPARPVTDPADIAGRGLDERRPHQESERVEQRDQRGTSRPGLDPPSAAAMWHILGTRQPRTYPNWQQAVTSLLRSSGASHARCPIDESGLSPPVGPFQGGRQQHALRDFDRREGKYCSWTGKSGDLNARKVSRRRLGGPRHSRSGRPVQSGGKDGRATASAGNYLTHSS